MKTKRNRPIRVAQIGLGFAGTHLHLPALRRIRGVKVEVAADPDERTHAAPGSMKVLSDWREALESGVDAAVVATPPETHAEIAGALLAAGIHVYLEKPLATGLAPAEALVQTVDETGLVLRMGYAYRFHPLWRRVKSLVDSGRFGPKLIATGRFTISEEGSEWNTAILNVGLHHVDLLSWLLGTAPDSAQATSEGTLVVTWPKGSMLNGKYEAGSPCDQVVIRCGPQSIAIDRLSGARLQASGMRLGRAGWIDPALMRAHLSSLGWERSFEYALSSFFGTIKGKLPDRGPNCRDGFAMVAAGEAILRSLESGSPEPISAGSS
jgi:predicted dehydrogenase